jgi:hypothetical protein
MPVVALQALSCCMRVASLRVRLAGLAGCLLLAACASEPVAPPATIAYKPAQRSTLVTRHDLNFVVATWLEDAGTTTMLARTRAGAAPLAVARVMQVRHGPHVQVFVHRLAASWAAADHADLALAALEHLYALVLHQEPVAR